MIVRDHSASNLFSAAITLLGIGLRSSTVPMLKLDRQSVLVLRLVSDG